MGTARGGATSGRSVASVGRRIQNNRNGCFKHTAACFPPLALAALLMTFPRREALGMAYG